MRIACILPWYLGCRTLQLMQQYPPLETQERVKVTRAEVRGALLWTPVVALSNRALKALERRLYFDKK